MMIRRVFPALLALSGLCVAAGVSAQGQTTAGSESSIERAQVTSPATVLGTDAGAVSGIAVLGTAADTTQNAAGATTQSTTTSTSQSSTTQSTTQNNGPSMMSPHARHTMPGQAYTKPTAHDRLLGYAFDTFGPYPLIGSALAAEGRPSRCGCQIVNVSSRNGDAQ